MSLLGPDREQTVDVGFFVDSAGVEGQKEVKLGLYSFSTEEGNGQTIIDQNNAELVLEGNLFFVRPLQQGEESGRTQFLRHQEEMFAILNS